MYTPKPQPASNRHLLRSAIEKTAALTSTYTQRACDASALVQFGVETMRVVAGPALPVVQRAVEFGLPVVDTIDGSIARLVIGAEQQSQKARSQFDAKYHQLSELKMALSESHWFRKVDEIWSKSKSQAQAYYELLVQHFLALLRVDHVPAFNEFLKSLRDRLSAVSLWDDALVSPTQQFYDAIIARINALQQKPADPAQAAGAVNFDLIALFKGLQLQLGQLWESQVVGVFERTRTALPEHLPSDSLFKTATGFYDSLGERVKTMQAPEFIDGVRNALGKSWQTNLQEPLKELWDRSKDVVARGQKEMKSRATVAVDNGKSYASQLTGFVSNTWQGLLGTAQATFDHFVPEPASGDTTTTSGNNTGNGCTSATSATHTSSASSTCGARKMKKEECKDTAAAGQRSLCNLSSHVTKRLRVKGQAGLQAGLGRIRVLSSGSLKNVLRVDVVAYIENAIHKSCDGCTYAQSEIQQRLNTALANVSRSAANIRKAVADVIASLAATPYGVRATEQWQSTKRKLTPHAQQLRIRLQQAIDRARALAVVGRNGPWLTAEQRRVLKQLPADVAKLVVSLPGVLSSLNLYYIRGSGDRKEYLLMVQQVRDMLMAIGDAFFWSQAKSTDAAAVPTAAGSAAGSAAAEENKEEEEEAEEAEEPAAAAAEEENKEEEEEAEEVEEGTEEPTAAAAAAAGSSKKKEAEKAKEAEEDEEEEAPTPVSPPQPKQQGQPPQQPQQRGQSPAKNRGQGGATPSPNRQPNSGGRRGGSGRRH